MLLALFAGGFFVVMGFLFVRMVQDAREAARGSQCRGHFKQLVMALHFYHDTFKCFPPAYTTDSHGRRMHSWRALILPWIEQRDIVAKYDFSKPWNDPANLAMADQINLDLFHCHSEPDHGTSLMTNYVVVVGQPTAFPGAGSTTKDDITDGLEDTILLVEIANSDIRWMEPRDLEFDKLSFAINDPHRPGISSSHPRGAGVCFANGVVIRATKSLRPATVRGLLTISGGEPLRKQALTLPSDGRGGQLGETPQVSGQ